MQLLYASRKIFQKNHANLWTFFESDAIFWKKNIFVVETCTLQ